MASHTPDTGSEAGDSVNLGQTSINFLAQYDDYMHGAPATTMPSLALLAKRLWTSGPMLRCLELAVQTKAHLRASPAEPAAERPRSYSRRVPACQHTEKLQNLVSEIKLASRPEGCTEVRAGSAVTAPARQTS